MVELVQNFSPACERNKQPILHELTKVLIKPAKVLEVGSGSGQHALHFCQALPHLVWQPTELPDNIKALSHNLSSAKQNNILSPLQLDVADSNQLTDQYDVIYSANTLHIMSWQCVESFFKLVGKLLQQPANYLIIYGPFKYQAQYTSGSNAQFEQWLKARDPLSGIRDFELVNELAEAEDFSLMKDVNMPANNQLLIWQK